MISKTRKNKYQERIIEKDGKKIVQYKLKRRYKNADGVVKNYTTGWCSSPRECEEAYADKVAAANKGFDPKLRDGTVGQILHKCVEHYHKLSKIENGEKNPNIITYDNLKSLRDNHTLIEIKNLKISKFKREHIKRWMVSINDEELSGNSVRRYKQTLHQFIKWMSNYGYIDDDEQAIFELTLSRVELKDKKEGSRTDDYWLRFKDLKSLLSYYQNKEYDFANYYWQMLFNFMYFSGVRVGEALALRWENITPKENGHYDIEILDATPPKESNYNFQLRYQKNNLSCKNDNSERIITSFDQYNLMLKDYRELYSDYYGVDFDEAQTWLVFPNLTARKGNVKQTHKNLRTQLEILENKKIIKHTNAQLFRHSAAHYMCDILNLPEARVHDQFGHTDSEMIRKVYGEAEKYTKQQKIDHALSIIITPQELTEELYKKEEVDNTYNELINFGSPVNMKEQRSKLYADWIEYKYRNSEMVINITKNSESFVKEAIKKDKKYKKMMLVSKK